MLFKHTDELKEECRFCGKKFKDSTAVRAHERTHSDVRPYACPRCDKTFKTSECLWHHENRSKTCGKSLGDMPMVRPCGGTRARRQSKRAGRSPSHLVLPPALPSRHVFHQEPKIELEDTASRHLNYQLQQPSIYIGSISPSAHFAEMVPTGSHHTASPDQPESGHFPIFDCAAVDWDLASTRPERADPIHPVVKVEAAEMMDLLDYNLAAFNPPSDSMSSYPDIFDKVGEDMVERSEEIYDDDDDDDEIDDDNISLDFKQSHQLLMQEINRHSVCHFCLF